MRSVRWRLILIIWLRETLVATWLGIILLLSGEAVVPGFLSSRFPVSFALALAVAQTVCLVFLQKDQETKERALDTPSSPLSRFMIAVSSIFFVLWVTGSLWRYDGVSLSIVLACAGALTFFFFAEHSYQDSSFKDS